MSYVRMQRSGYAIINALPVVFGWPCPPFQDSITPSVRGLQDKWWWVRKEAIWCLFERQQDSHKTCGMVRNPSEKKLSFFMVKTPG